MIRFVDYDIVFQEIPDEVTLAVNLSGCPNHCLGCHSPQLMEPIGEELTSQLLLSLIRRYASAITCVCFMGGDGSPEEVARLAQVLRSHTSLKVGWYSGRECWPNDLHLFDYVKLGPYVESRGGLRNPSTNQRLYALSDGHPHDITARFWS